jgi:hypothetical protein
MRLYIEGHNHKRGYAVSRTWSDAECSTMPPVAPDKLLAIRYFQNPKKARRFVQRWNGLYATH